MVQHSKLDLNKYIEAATRENTRVSYRAAIRHFEEDWHGILPATPDSIAQYLAHYAPLLANSTLKNRLSGLAPWHQDQGFPDPTKSPLVRSVMKGIRREHPHQAKQATVIQLDDLKRLDQWFAEKLASTPSLVWARNRAIIYLGFWRALRADELSRIQVENIKTTNGDFFIYLPSSKGDRQNAGQSYQVPRLKALCPVQACEAWLKAAHLSKGPLFRKIEQNEGVASHALHSSSFSYIIKQTFSAAGIKTASSLTSHSLRRGFATWAANSGWDVKTLMQYVGWQDAQTAMRYVQSMDPFHSISILTKMDSEE